MKIVNADDTYYQPAQSQGFHYEDFAGPPDQVRAAIQEWLHDTRIFPREIRQSFCFDPEGSPYVFISVWW